MPLVEIAVYKDYFTKEEKTRMAKAVKNALMNEIKAMKNESISSWVFVREVDVMEKSE
jgi:phenylpyruvate tautomerase PptA (4-oxalocrotonate tautomerase family)